MVYRALADRYGWPAEVVGRMTLAQQLMYLETNDDTTGDGRRVVRFDTLEEWHAAKLNWSKYRGG